MSPRCRCQESCHAGQVHGGGTNMRARAVVLAVALVQAPLGAQAADLVVWWFKLSPHRAISLRQPQPAYALPLPDGLSSPDWPAAPPLPSGKIRVAPAETGP